MVFVTAGIAVSYPSDLPSGPVIILIAGAAYLLVTLLHVVAQSPLDVVVRRSSGDASGVGSTVTMAEDRVPRHAPPRQSRLAATTVRIAGKYHLNGVHCGGNFWTKIHDFQ